VRRDVPRAQELEAIELEEVVDPENPTAVIFLLERALVQADEPEEAGQMKDRVRIVDVLAVAGAEVVEGRPRTGVVEIDSDLAERAVRVLSIRRNELALVDAIVDVDDVLVPTIVDRHPAHEHLGDGPVEVRDPVRLGPDSIEVEGSSRGAGIPLMDDSGAMVRKVGEIVSVRDRSGNRAKSTFAG